MATRTGSINLVMIHLIHRIKRCCRMASSTLIGSINVVIRFARRDNTIVTNPTISQYLIVIYAGNGRKKMKKKGK